MPTHEFKRSEDTLTSTKRECAHTKPPSIQPLPLSLPLSSLSSEHPTVNVWVCVVVSTMQAFSHIHIEHFWRWSGNAYKRMRLTEWARVKRIILAHIFHGALLSHPNIIYFSIPEHTKFYTYQCVCTAHKFRLYFIIEYFIHTLFFTFFISTRINIYKYSTSFYTRRDCFAICCPEFVFYFFFISKPFFLAFSLFPSLSLVVFLLLSLSLSILQCVWFFSDVFCRCCCCIFLSLFRYIFLFSFAISISYAGG